MRKIIIAPDSFKGTLSSVQVCQFIQAAAQEVFPACEVLSVPIADGGEGSVDCMLAAAGGKRCFCTVTGPLFSPVRAYYGRLNGGAAVVETAACAGLPLVQEPSPLHTTTYGVGELIAEAAHRGAEQIYVGLGGSATNDGGCGMAAALGARFYNARGEAFVPVGGTLGDVARIDVTGIDKRIAGLEITAMCDIENPLFGPRGAAYVFGPQKGADTAAVELLDAGLRHLAATAARDIGINCAEEPGAGAAGGLGFGMRAFLGARLRSGIDTALEASGFDVLLQDVDLVVTGEGRLDAQSGMGKAVGGVALLAKRAGVPVVALAGGIAADSALLGLDAAFSINRLPEPLSVSGVKSGDNLYRTALELFRLIRLSLNAAHREA